MFQVKICGITRVEDALLAADAGADAIGLNFFPGSARFVAPETARDIVEGLGRLEIARRPRIVGVFVNSSWDEVVDAMELGLDAVQLHGDESPEQLFNIKWAGMLAGFSRLSRPQPWLDTIRAFRCGKAGLQEVNDYLRRCENCHPEGAKGRSTLPHAVLLDAYTPGAYGGTGHVVDWACVRRDRDLLLGLPIILAGGLTPDNVAEAVETARPDGVDTASGVEDSPGRKNEVKVRAFVSAAKAAFDRTKSLP